MPPSDPPDTIRDSTTVWDSPGVQREPAEALRDRKFGAYRILELIGRGGMGSVFKAKRVDGELDQIVAIKLAERLSLDPQADERFRRERQILADLIHPNIARLLDGGTSEDGIAYLVMEFIPGTRIDEYCDEKQLDVKSRLRLFLQLCDAVAYAHEHLVVHRDLKPSNVLVTSEGELKLLDFGVAKVLDLSQGQQTQTLILTPDYASPEQVTGAPVTTATDVYGLGAVLYQLLTGKSPRTVSDVSPVRLLEAYRVPIVRPRRHAPALARDLENILLKALHPQPERRYRSAREFAEDLERFLDRRPVKASPDRFPYRAHRFWQRHRVAVMAACFALAAILSVTLAYIREAHRAERRFAQVRTLASRSLFDFEKSIRNIPGTLKARRQVAATAREYLQSLSEDAQGDKDLIRELAESYDRLGAIDQSLGQTQTALLDYKKSLTLIESVGDDRAGSAAQRLQFLKTSARVAYMEGESGQVSNALKRSNEAVDLARAWISQAGPIPEAQQALLLALAVRGSSLEQSGDETGSRKDLEEARSVALPLMQNDPRNDDLAFLAVRPIYALADLCNALKDGSAGYRYGKEAREILDRLVRDQPENRLWRRIRIMAISAVAGGADLLAKQQPAFREQAIGYSKEAYEAAKAGALRDPEDDNELDDYIVMTQRLAIHLDHANRASEAIPLTKEAQLKIFHLIQMNPKDARNRYLRADNRLLTAEMLADLHRWKDADETLTEAETYLEDALKGSPNDGVVLEDKIALINDQVTVARQRQDQARARERCSAGLDLASQLIRQDPAMASYLTSLPDLQQQAKQLGIPDITATLKTKAN